MLKRLAIVISACIGIVFVPYFIGRLIPFDYLEFGSFWLSGFMALVVLIGSILICYVLFYMIPKEIYKYIKNGE